MKTLFLLALLTVTQVAAGARLPASAFDYPKTPFDIEVVNVERRDGVEVRDITFRSVAGGRTAAYLVIAPKTRKAAAILFAHWYEPASSDSNRTQFLPQAIELAKGGATSMLIETLWSEPSWFPKRNPADDFSATVTQVKDFRRALDVLLSQPKIDNTRVAFVGHDLGMMCGAVLAGVDHRVHAWALQAGTTSFSNWYLYMPRLQGDARQAKIDELAPLDPVRYIADASPSPVLMQFGKSDRHVPADKAQAMFDAAREPRIILWYDAGHHLNDQAIADRQEWLRKTLVLHKS